MSASAVRVKSTTVVSPETDKSDESLPSLFGRLGDDVMQLFDTKMSLLKVEIKEEASEYARDGVMIGAGGIIAAVGFALLNVALAFGISTLFANTDLSQAAKYAASERASGATPCSHTGLVVAYGYRSSTAGLA